MYNFSYELKDRDGNCLTLRQKLIMDIVNDLSNEDLVNYADYPDALIADGAVASVIDRRLKDFLIIQGTIY